MIQKTKIKNGFKTLTQMLLLTLLTEYACEKEHYDIKFFALQRNLHIELFSNVL